MDHERPSRPTGRGSVVTGANGELACGPQKTPRRVPLLTARWTPARGHLRTRSTFHRARCSPARHAHRAAVGLDVNAHGAGRDAVLRRDDTAYGRRTTDRFSCAVVGVDPAGAHT
jgi:hypothetical protein